MTSARLSKLGIRNEKPRLLHPTVDSERLGLAAQTHTEDHLPSQHDFG